jgi:hypothetical protein
LSARRAVLPPSVIRHFIGREETDMIKRKDNQVMQFIIGAGSPVTWTAVLLIAVWFWS